MLTESGANALMTFETLESNVRSYSRSFPVVFRRALGATLEDEKGFEFVDFLAGSGVLNYGHNDEDLLASAIDYLKANGVVHGLDMATTAKRRFLEAFEEIILRPRRMVYKLQFPGPTGANAVEAALKLARKATRRQGIISFHNGFHGVSLGALAVTGNRYYRNAAGFPPSGGVFMPYDGYLGPGIDTAEYLDKLLGDASSGIDLPAAVIVETVQGEGGIRVASERWLRSLEQLCRKYAVLLIVDDIQAGCGRTGDFFSFECAGLSPDIVVLSKSLSGCGLPLSVLLLKPELDVWGPGEHNGTFRGNNLALVTATAALEKYWTGDELSERTKAAGTVVGERLRRIAQSAGDGFVARGRGMMQGLDCGTGQRAEQIMRSAFQCGLIVERCGAEDEVIKLLPPLTIDSQTLQRGLDILDKSVGGCVRDG